MNDTKINSIVEKVKKLLSLATSSNEHEASLAAQRAHALLVKHNLSMQQIKESAPRQYLRQAVDTRIFQQTAEKYVAQILESHFFVRWVQVRRANDDRWGENLSKSTWYDRTVILVGTQANVEIAAYVRAFLVDKYNDLWLVYKRQNGALPAQQQSYYTGLTKGLDKKLTAQRHKIEQEYGLVLIRDKDLDDHVDATAGNAGTYRVEHHEDVIRAGIEDGKRIEIQKGLTSHAENKGLRLVHHKEHK